MNTCQSMPQKNDDDGDSPHRALGENTPMRVGFGLILASYIALSSWWASAINSKLNVVVNGQQVSSGDMTALRARIEANERNIDRINVTGSPRVVDLEKRLSTLEKDFELHKALTAPQKPSS